MRTGSGIRVAAAVLVIASCGFTAQAVGQVRPEQVEQIGETANPTASVGQIAADDRPGDLQIAPGSAGADPVRQISVSSQSRGAPTQLTRESEGQSAPVQLYRGGRTAQPSAGLSRPSDGRTSAVTRVEGRDRCDRADDRSVARPEACRHVIESRSAEFVRAEPEVSAEQRLLGEQRLREQAASSEAAARRLASHGGDPDSLEEQGIASLVLRDLQPSPPRDEMPSEQTSTIIEAIVGAMTGTPPQ